MSNLLEYYHRFDRVLLTGTLNYETQTFDSATKKRQQIQLTLPVGFYYNQYIKTTLGTGEIKDYEESLQNKHVKLTLIYD